MRKVTALILVTTASALLAGCGGGGLLNRDRPDEFAVQRQSPLVVPPDFALTPPQQGAPRPVETSGQQQTLDALFGGPAARSEVEKNTISRAGTAAPGIRSTVGDNQTNTVAKGDVTRDIIAAPQGDGREAQAVAGGAS
ncbi:MAG TPA: DUF3035 domain-containing protein [Novosphingobium sp.]